MKCSIVFLLSLCFGFTAKAQSLQSDNYYKQKRWLDSSLRNDRKWSTVITNLNSTMAYNMPVLPLPNEESLMNKIETGTIYNMKLDNMPCLKPSETNATTPNAIIGKQWLIPPTDTKP